MGGQVISTGRGKHYAVSWSRGISSRNQCVRYVGVNYGWCEDAVLRVCDKNRSGVRDWRAVVRGGSGA